MESGPAVFAGTVFALFGGALLIWTAVRLHRREPVAEGVSRAASTALASLVAVAALVLAAWSFSRL
ncbi:hypothetical protein [Streptomyces sp. NPDC007264]|uniref:hypothetical protein n=1 Tax=Streptomyces sp. NPDC007264 TaxID=3364777 RepID=UPI0036DF5362